jgi:hypothetical protein
MDAEAVQKEVLLFMDDLLHQQVSQGRQPFVQDSREWRFQRL